VTTVAHEVRKPVFVPPRQSWGDAFYATILGWVMASVVAFVAVIAAHALGVLSGSFVGIADKGLRTWPYPENGTFSLVANAVVWLDMVALTALLVRGVLADRIGPVSAVPIAVVLAVTGFVPLLPHGALDLPGLVAFGVTA
jgi:hypothetical protein